MAKKEASRTVVLNGQRLKELRAAKGWSRRQLAQKVGCSPGAIDNAGNGKPVLVKTLYEIAQALKVSDPNTLRATKETPQDISVSIHVGDDSNRSLEALPGLHQDIQDAYEQYNDFVKTGDHDFERHLENWKKRKQKDEERKPPGKTDVYYIPAFDTLRNEPCYYFVLCSALLREAMAESLKEGNIPHFAVVVYTAHGHPTEDVKQYIKELYGFDYDKEMQGRGAPNA
jgi:transcriptional regulator with XRE-family HTH domain